MKERRMARFGTKSKTSFADIISFCGDAKSERGASSAANRSVDFDVMSLRSKSPRSYPGGGELAAAADRSWTSPVEKEAMELSAKKRFAVLNMIEKNWKVNLRSKIETDISDQVQQALEPLHSSRAFHDEKKSERQKNLQMMRFAQQHHFASRDTREEGGVGGGKSFKYIDVNYLPQRRLLAGVDNFTQHSYSKDKKRSFNNLRLPDRRGFPGANALYGLEELARQQRQAANMRGGLDITLIDANNSGIDFLNLAKNQMGQNGLRPIVPNVIAYNGLSLPNYGANRRCFQTYTKEGMNSLLNSRTRRGKLTHLGHGRYVDKRGVVISRLGPFWPQGYGPVCQCPEFTTRCPQEEDHGAHSGVTTAVRLPLTNNHDTPRRATNGDHVAKQMTPRDPAAKDGAPQWRGKPVIYDCDRSSRAPLPHSVADGLDESIVFESRFESGNLRQVRRIGEHEYELVLRTDMYTNRHTQWYYFRLQRAKRGCKYKFNLINFLKKDSLYNYGMRPLIYSEHLAREEEKGWHRSGENIRYFSWNNPTRNALLSLDLQYFCLEFEISFDWEGVEDDTIYMAHCYPYTYSDLRRHLDDVMNEPARSLHVKKEVLCETAAGNACFLLTVTDFPDREKDKYKDFHQGKQGVVLTARVHPGETQASWMMKGAIDFLTSSHPSAEKLRQKYVFKIVPMLNPDGVIVGNYRTSLAARDLNRNYRHPRQTTFPTIWHTKQMVDQFNKDHPIVLYCDLHGHSRRHMVFMYGCERRCLHTKTAANKQPNRQQPAAVTSSGDVIDDTMMDARDFVDERLFPWLMYRLTPSRFSFHGTKFAIRRTKESTGRVVMFRQMGILNSFTMEASFSGTINGRHFNIDDFQLVGKKLCECVLEYARLQDDPIAKSRVILDMTRELAQQAITSQKPTNQVESESSQKDGGESVRSGGSSSKSDPDQGGAKSSKARAKTRAGDGQVEVSKSSRRDDASREGARRNVDGEKSAGEKDAATGKGAAASVDENCFKLLQRLNVFQMENESETSSESNSDSEPEMTKEEQAGGGRKLRGIFASASQGKKKKRRKSNNKGGGGGTHKSAPAPTTGPPNSLQRNKQDDFASVKGFHANLKGAPQQQHMPQYPAYVNKYANRSNGGIPIFAQERIKERAARRLAELKLADEERRQQQQLKQQLILAGLQDGPAVPYETSAVAHGEDPDNYSEICGLRYQIGNHTRKVQYVMYNPYRSTSPAQERRPLVTMRFSPPMRRNDGLATTKKSPDLYLSHRVRAHHGGRLSRQRALKRDLHHDFASDETASCSSSVGSQRGVTSDFRDDLGDYDVIDDDIDDYDDVIEPTMTTADNRRTSLANYPTTDVSPHDTSSVNNSPADNSQADSSPVNNSPRDYSPPDNSPQNENDDDGETSHQPPRTVVVPIQRYNVSFSAVKKPWQTTQKLQFTVAARPLPPPDPADHDVIVTSDVTDAARYPGAIQRTAGPPMVFGEPAVMNQKQDPMTSMMTQSVTMTQSRARVEKAAASVDDSVAAARPNGADGGVIANEIMRGVARRKSDLTRAVPSFVRSRFVAVVPPRSSGDDEHKADKVRHKSNDSYLPDPSLR